MYVITFFDKTFIKVSDEVGEKVIYGKKNNSKTFSINENLYDFKALAKIEKIKAEKHNLLPQKTDDPVKKETLEKMKKEMAKKFNWK